MPELRGNEGILELSRFVISRRNFAKVWPTIIAHPLRALHIFSTERQEQRDAQGKVEKGRRHERIDLCFNHLRRNYSLWKKKVV